MFLTKPPLSSKIFLQSRWAKIKILCCDIAIQTCKGISKECTYNVGFANTTESNLSFLRLIKHHLGSNRARLR